MGESDGHFEWPYPVAENREEGLKIAFVTLVLPNLPGKSGGEIRDGHILGYLSSRHVVDVFSINNFVHEISTDQMLSQLNDIYYPEKIAKEFPDYVNFSVKDDYLKKFRRKLARSDLFIPLGKLPCEVEGFMTTFNAYIKHLLQEKINENRYNVIFVTPQVNPALLSGLEIPDSCLKIYATYDVEKVRYKRLKKTKKSVLSKMTFRLEERKAIRMEANNVSIADGIIAVSELDRKVFVDEYGVPSHRVLSLENGVDTRYFSLSQGNTNKEPILVFIGNMGYAPNRQAVEYFVDLIFPKVLKRFPDAKFFAVGANADSDLKKLGNDKNIIITGEVPDVRLYLNMADVVCIPLLTGSGTKYKVLEALSAGKPVVTTSIGAEGIDVSDSVHLLIRDGEQQFANGVIDCLSNPQDMAQMGLRGRRFVEAHHDWKVVLPKMDQWMVQLARSI